MAEEQRERERIPFGFSIENYKVHFIKRANNSKNRTEIIIL